jgi:spore coat protein A
MRFTRREALKLGLAATVSAPLGATGCSLDVSFSGDEQIGKLLSSDARLPEAFTIPLRTPPVLQPVRSDDEADYYELAQRVGEIEILPGLKTAVWGYDGIFPGPTIEARSGRRVSVRIRNELPVPTVTHLHGGVTPPESDGYPTDLVLPVNGGFGVHEHDGAAVGTVSEGEKEYIYPLEQRAATLWYHDHRMDFTGPQVWAGLAGFFIVRDDEEGALPLPKGERDIPLMIADRSFDAGGALIYPARDRSLAGEPGVTDDFMEGVLGDTILVNGVPWPYLDVAAARYRFRILNASNARRYELELDPAPDGDAPLIQIGSDGGLLDAPVALERLPISPAERYDVVIDFSGYPVGSRVTLRNRVDGGPAEVMEFRVAHEALDDSSVPERLAEIERLDPDDASETRPFRFHRGSVRGHRGWLVNDEPFDPERIDARVPLGATEIWEIRGNTHHPFHIHLAHFQILERNGREPSAHDTGWKDTVNLDDGDEVRVIARFDGYRGKYVFHCHNLEHEDMMMMANFEVI